MKQLFFTLALMASIQCFGQKIFIEASDKYSYNQISQKVSALGFTIDSANYDYKLKLNIRQTSKINSMFRGYVSLHSKDGAELDKTKEIRRGAVAVNGFNASYNIAKVIAESHLEAMLGKIKSKN